MEDSGSLKNGECDHGYAVLHRYGVHCGHGVRHGHKVHVRCGAQVMKIDVIRLKDGRNGKRLVVDRCFQRRVKKPSLNQT